MSSAGYVGLIVLESETTLDSAAVAGSSLGMHTPIQPPSSSVASSFDKASMFNSGLHVAQVPVSASSVYYLINTCHWAASNVCHRSYIPGYPTRRFPTIDFTATLFESCENRTAACRINTLQWTSHESPRILGLHRIDLRARRPAVCCL